MRIDGLGWAAARARAENDLYWFSRFVLNYDQLDETYHGDICQWLDDFDHGTATYGLLMQPRGHYKTTMSCSRIIQHWLRDPNKRFMLGSAKLKLAIDIASIIKHHCETNEALRWLGRGLFWDDLNQATRWLQDKICINRTDVSNTYSLECASPEAGLTSKHFHEIVLDDAVDGDNCKTPYQRESVKEWYRHCMDLLLVGGKVLDIGTAWHYDDMHSLLRDESGPQSGSTVRKINGAFGKPGVTSGEPIFPRRYRVDNHRPYGWDTDSLAQRRIDQSDRVFFAQMLNDPTPRSEAIFKRSNFVWFDSIKPPTDRECTYWTAVDPNRGSKAEAGDYGVVMTGARDHEGDIWIVDIYRGRPTQMELIEVIGQHVQRWNPKSVFMEVTAGQLTMAEALRAWQIRTGITFHQVDVNRSTKSTKEDRILSLEGLVERRGLHLKIGLCDELALELEHHGAWKHDDQVDCLADIWMKSTPPLKLVKKQRLPTNPNTFAAVHKEAVQRREMAMSRVPRKVWNA